jgi:protein O-GlcNAc transferase
MLAANSDTLRSEAYRLFQAGDRAGAERLCHTLLQSSPNDPEAIYLLGVIAQAAGRLQEAVARYGQAVRLAPENATMVNAQGEACFSLGQLDEALASFQRAQALRPAYERVHNNLGRLYHVRGDLSRARASFVEAVRLNPRYAIAHNNLGAVMQAQGEPAVAAASYRQAIALEPNYPEAHFNLGTNLQAEGDPESAAARLKEAIRLRPNYARAYFHLGQVLASLRQDYDALACYQEAARLRPDDAETQLRLGDHLLLKKDWSAAIEALERAVSLQPSKAEPMARLAQARQLVCDWRTYASDSDRLWTDAERQLAGSEATAVVPFQALTLPWSLPRLLAIARSHSDAMARHQLRHSLNLPHPREARGRLRIGYLSGDFYDHPIAHLLHGFFERHDRACFEVFAYSFAVPDDSVYRKRIVAGCEHFVEVATMSIPDLARRIAADGIHVLVDLMGHTGVNRLGALALRPAPIQVSFLGMLGTMGADFVDYLIGDRTVTPPEFAPEFTEKFVTMPNSYFIAEPEPALPTAEIRRADYGLPETGFVYCSFNNTYKFEPRIFEVWMNILREAPDSVLWLFSSGSIAEANLRREAHAREVAPERLVFAPFRPRPDHLLRHRAADLFLDTLVYNAAATSSLALQSGLPVLTCLGDTFASRVGASLLHAAGLPELIAADLKEYQRRAIELARQPGDLGRLREQLLAQRSTAPLFDTSRFVRNLERAYRAMWNNYANGRPPQPINVAETQ